MTSAIYIIYDRRNHAGLTSAIRAVLQERAYPVYINPKLEPLMSEEASIRYGIALMRRSDAVLLASDDLDLRKNIANRIELAAASELHKIVFMNPSAMRTWLVEQEEKGDELVDRLMRRCSGLKLKAINKLDKLFGGDK